ncbi:DUF2510 domain-containing protein [Actinomadura rugatobispora]|uniref:DUF2510 domain-containing protein n=1 Tax=Actinomadura rugatobispora TaxID=1994 RepID=A0ABW1AD42_9ACTN|nr:hypothetical protein GCM10010200_060950 [Actinomadura rugatobispora]
MSQPGWYPDPKGSGSLRWWNGQHWTENLNPEPPAASRRPPAEAPLHAPPYARAVDATVRGVLLHADERAVTYGGASLPWGHVEWVAYWAATPPGERKRPPPVQWIFQAGRHPFHGGPRVEVVLDDLTVTANDPAAAGGRAEAVWRELVELCRACAERRLVDELVRSVRGGGSVDVAQGLTVHPGGVRGERVSLSWSAISGAVLENGRVWIRQSNGTAPILYVPQQNPNAVLIPALLAGLGGPLR